MYEVAKNINCSRDINQLHLTFDKHQNKFNNMNIFNLPPELFQLSLSQLSSDELIKLFDLPQIFSGTSGNYDPYLEIRHMAYCEYITRMDILVSNKPLFDPCLMTLDKLRYLINHNIIIHPKSITIEITDNENKCRFINQLFHYRLIDYIAMTTKNINLSMELTNDNHYIIQKLYDYIAEHNYSLNVFSLKFDGRHLSSHPFHLSISMLQLRFKDASRLFDHFHSYGTNLQSLDLSFNRITDLSIIPEFPSSITTLNLSNNNLISLNNDNFNWKSLTNLKVLDLSNNNIVYIDLPDTRNTSTYQLQELNLSSNNLTTIPKLTNTPFCKSLQNLDLSRNLFSKLLYSFPSGLVKLNLKGNYFYDFYQQINGRIFPKSLKYLDLSYCHIASSTTNDVEFKQDIYKKLVDVENLQDLQWLQVDM